jgi:uncharacterized coiled-coil DUF342 family protein
LDRDQLERKVSGLKSKLKKQRQKYQNLVAELDKLREAASELKTHRDKLNTEIKKLVSEGNAHKTYSANLKIYISFLKLRKKLRDQLNTILMRELNLKDEIVLYDMIFELYEQYQRKKHTLPSTLSPNIGYTDINELEAHIDKLQLEQERHHKRAIECYRNKVELRKRADSYHAQMVECNVRIRDKQAEVKAFKLVMKPTEEAFDRYNKVLMRVKHAEYAKLREQKLQIAKEKRARKGKLDLEELRLLLDEGEL